MHSFIDKGNRIGHSAHFSFHFTVDLLFLHSSHFYYQKSECSATQTSQTKRCLFNIRILLEVRSFAAPKHVQKTCCCTEWRPLGVAVSLRHRHHWSKVMSHWHSSHATHPLFILRLGKWLKGARRHGTVQNETQLVSQSGVSYPSAVLQGSSAIY